MIIPNTFGGSLVGDLLAAACFGIVTVQVSSYYHSFPNDRRPLKLAVGVLWVVEAYQVAGVTWSLYRWFITNSQNPLALKRATWEYATYQICTAFASATVQTFFAHRLYSLSGKLYIGVFVQVLVLFQFGLGVTFGVKANTLIEFEAIVKEYRWLLETWLTIQVVADLVIATYMSLLLRHRRTGFRNTDSAINRMVLYTINTGIVTSVLSCIILALFAKYGFDFGAVAISMSLGPCYAITMLANLHMRKTFRERLATPGALELINYPINMRKRPSAGDHGGEGGFQATMIHVAKEVVYDDGDLNPTSHQTSDTKAQFTADQSPVWEAT